MLVSNNRKTRRESLPDGFFYSPRHLSSPTSVPPDDSYAATSTLIVRGFASSRKGSVTVSTPFLKLALT